MRAAWDGLGSTTQSVIMAGCLYLIALAIRLLAAAQVSFPVFEPSAYFSGVAENLVQGDGLVSNAVWSYATPPLVVPKPAFELWLPMSSLVSALAMAGLGTSYWAAQIGSALLGALVAPLAWAVGHASARSAGLDPRRGRAVAVTSGLLAATLSPLVLATAVPDSSTPFTVFAVIATLLIPGALGAVSGSDGAQAQPRWRWGLALGVALGFAYLSRQEVIWLGLTVLLMLGWMLRSWPAEARLREGLARIWPVVVGGIVIVGPWLLRNMAVFGSAFPGQAIENMFLVHNEDIFAFAERPNVARYLDQGLGTLLSNPMTAAWDGFVNVLLIPAFPIGLAGLIALVGMRHSTALRRPTALLALLVSGGLTFAGTVLLFPVATRWGTFLHASGPILVALIVVTALGTDALMARLSTLRRWGRPNIIIGPVALVSITAALALLQLDFISAQSNQKQARYDSLSTSIIATAQLRGVEIPGTIITDHPMWLADVLDRHAVALPDEDVSSIIALGRQFDASWVVVADERGRYPDALHRGSARGCLAAEPIELLDDTDPAWLFMLADNCTDAMTR